MTFKMPAGHLITMPGTKSRHLIAGEVRDSARKLFHDARMTHGISPH